MATLESLRSSIESVDQMLSVVKTMKALAAVNIRQFEGAVESLAEYNETIAQGLQVLLQDQPPVELTEPLAGQRLGIIVFGSEQGLAGQFNERVAAYTIERTQNFDDDWNHRQVMVVGERVTGHLVDGGLHVTQGLDAPNSLDGIRQVGRNILLRIDSWRQERDVERIILFYNTPTSSASYQPRSRWLLPVNPRWLRSLQNNRWESRARPIYTIPREQLFSQLIRQYFFVTLYRALAESLASENASRLASMQAAERNIEDRLGELEGQYQHQRKRAITEEILDIASGFEALTNE
ncbi:MAG: F0F1 ATP synthase subunit gamma [Phototrophicaceae bacterium]